jgi:hypothetical protein
MKFWKFVSRLLGSDKVVNVPRTLIQYIYLAEERSVARLRMVTFVNGKRRRVTKNR